MLGLKMTKKGWGGGGDNDNIRSRSKSRERVSLLGQKNGGHSNEGLRGQQGRRRARGGDQEMVSLLGGRQMQSPGKLKRGNGNYKKKKLVPITLKQFILSKIRWTKWTYLFVLVLSTFLTFKFFRKSAKILNWDNFDDVLNPKLPKDQRCFEETIEIISHVTGKSRTLPCACSDPNVALENTKDKLWKSNHERMVSEAKNPPQDLDIVFFGDGMVEQLSGSRDLGESMLDGMEPYFEKTFRKRRGGKFNALALGSSGDTGPNLLWHWENGIQQANLRPKLWFIVVGGNDLYVNKCKDEFVMASVLNVAKRIFDDQPDAKIVVHGIIPRKDDLEAKSNNLGDLWNRAQGTNLHVRKFIKKHSSRIHFMNLGQVLMGHGGFKGRKAVNPQLIQGIYPTPKGMQTWGNLAVKKLTPIIRGFDREAHRKKTKKPDPAAENNLGATGEIGDLASF